MVYCAKMVKRCWAAERNGNFEISAGLGVEPHQHILKCVRNIIMNNNDSLKINDVLGYSTNGSNWCIPRRECIPSEEREKYITKRSKDGLSKTSLRSLNRYIDEYLIFIKKNNLEKTYSDDSTLAVYSSKINSSIHINENTKYAKLNTAAKWIKWIKSEELIKSNLKEV